MDRGRIQRIGTITLRDRADPVSADEQLAGLEALQSVSADVHVHVLAEDLLRERHADRLAGIEDAQLGGLENRFALPDQNIAGIDGNFFLVTDFQPVGR